MLITPGQPSSNPRLAKEAVALYQAGYEVSVLYCFWTAWAEESDTRLFASYPGIRWICAGGRPGNGMSAYWYTRLRHKLQRKMLQFFPSTGRRMERSLSRAAIELENLARKLPADLYIAHNLAALRPAAIAAAKNGGRYAFDGEDYHRGQESPGSPEYRQTVLTEDHYLPGAAYCTAASPLIGTAYQKDYPALHPTVINNVFSLGYLQPPPIPYKTGDELKLFWFSQTVGRQRGLEEAIAAMASVTDIHLSLTILGSCSPEMRGSLQDLARNAGLASRQLNFHDPVDLDGIFPLAHTHHIGLALEVKTIGNRQICLTNKLFTYMLAGLFTVATDTAAQTRFLAENPGIGETYPAGDAQKLGDIIASLAKDPEKLNAARVKAQHLATTNFNWEAEQRKFLACIHNALS